MRDANDCESPNGERQIPKTTSQTNETTVASFLAGDQNIEPLIHFSSLHSYHKLRAKKIWVENNFNMHMTRCKNETRKKRESRMKIVGPASLFRFPFCFCPSDSVPKEEKVARFMTRMGNRKGRGERYPLHEQKFLMSHCELPAWRPPTGQPT